MSTQDRAQFTPGPWEHKGYRVYRKGSYAVAWIEQQGPHSEWQANGKIIAAAPAMYEALQVAQRYLKQCQGHDEEWQIVTDALAQAEGRQ